MKKIHLILALLLSTNIILAASEREDIAFLDELYKQKKFSMAITESVSFLKRYPDSRYTRNIQDRIAKTYFLQEDYNNAIKYFKIILMNNDVKAKEKDEINFYLMKSYTALEDTKNSDFYMEALDKNGDFYERALYDSGMTYLAKENYLKAEEMFQRVIQMNKKYYSEAILSMAMSSYNKADYKKTLLFLNEYSNGKDKNKNQSLLYYLYGSTYYKLNSTEDAIVYFQKVANKDKISSYGKKSILSLIEIYSNRGDVNSMQRYLTMLENTKEYGEAMRMIGDLYATRGEYEKAVGYYSKTNTPNDPKLMYGYGFSLYKLNRLKEAQKYFEGLRNTTYYNQSLYYIFAIDYKLKNYKKIVRNRDEVKRVVVNQQDTDNINLMIANSAYEVGEYALSKDYYGRLYARNPNKENLYRIIVIDNKVGDIEDITKRFTEYKAKYSDDKEYKRNIYFSVGEAYYKGNKVSEAIDVYKEFLATDKDFSILNNLIVSLLSEQRYDEMLTYLNDEGTESSKENIYLKGIAFVGMGKYAEAETVFNQLEADDASDIVLQTKVKFNKMRNYFLWGKYEDAIKYGEEYLQLENPEGKNEVMDKLAISYFRLDNFEKSREYYNKLSTVPEFEAYGRFQIADTYYAEKNFEKAKEEYKHVAEQYGDGQYGEKAYYWYLTTLINLGETDIFEKEKDAFLIKYPGSKMKDNLLILSGEVYESGNNNDKALESYKEILSTSEDKVVKESTVSKILDIHLSKNNIEEAKKYIEDITNIDTKNYYNSLIYEKQNNKEAAMKEYEKLLESSRYKDYACVNIASKLFAEKNYKKAREYYNQVNNMENSIYKDLVLFQIASIDEIEKKNEEALRGYTKGYVMYDGKYSQVSKLKAAQLNEKMGKEKDAEVLYKELYNLDKKLIYKEFVLEKMIYFALKNENKVEGKKYYLELKAINAKKAEKYVDFFKEEENK